MRQILDGEKPTVVFERLLRENPDLTNADLAWEFRELFERVSIEALHGIWNWRRPGRSAGLDDHEVDEILAFYLEEAGYLITPPIVQSVQSPLSTGESVPKKEE